MTGLDHRVENICNRVPAAFFSGALALALLAPAAFADQHPNDQQPYVAQVVLTQSVGADRMPGAPLSGAVSAGPVVVWTKVHGTAAGIQAMHSRKEMPVRHMWHVRCGSSAQEMLLDDVSLVVGTSPDMPAMQQEVDMRGFFDWRTWSRKQNLLDCNYRIVVADSKGQPLHCADLKGPCEVSFEGRRQ